MAKKLILVALVAALSIGMTCGEEPFAVDVTVTASEEIDSQDIPYANFV
ncbi:hypothetical protein GF359_10035 [candidate division WOR-3 bacterium]|uniref:Uncharacterized protein n=1 Tax=candidate division WOR-3 bacterium TaxID=2052148 RepID=A0A9D5KB86_UNCW3|nr:hypothetical protein [candidate division WOR-3 bacterium]MBD3365540.1 hypothetical protein [candidate division WOR-3 bacterium]